MAAQDYRRHVLHFYDRYARWYDLGEIFRRGTRNKAVALTGCRPRDRVLDVCTGTGELGLAFARHGAEVVGVDLVQAVLECASQKRVDGRTTWIQIEATKLGFENGAFVASAISLGLHYMLEPTQVSLLAEMARVTRGRIVIVEPHAPCGRPR